jgi:hypothetical protein
MQLSPFLQNLAKRIIVAVDNEIVEHELILRFAYLRSIHKIYVPESGDGGSEHVRFRVHDLHSLRFSPASNRWDRLTSAASFHGSQMHFR